MPTCFYLFSAETYFWHFGAWVPFSGSETLFLPFWPTKVYFFVLHVKFPIDGYITRPYWFWAPNSVFGLWGPIFAFLTPKSIFLLAPCKFPDLWIYHRTILILDPKFWFWAPNSVFGLWGPIFAFLTPKSIFLLAPCKIPDRWIYHTIILIFGPKFRFWALKAYFCIFDP
jgi:hypothetical protein